VIVAFILHPFFLKFERCFHVSPSGSKNTNSASKPARWAVLNFLAEYLSLLLHYHLQSEKMKRHHFILIGTFFVLLAVCEKKMEEQKKFFRLMEKNSKSITILQISSNNKIIDFTGEITLSDHEIEFRLLNENRAFYAIRFHSLNSFSVDGTFCASPGDRKIERSSFDRVFAILLIVFAVRGSLGKPCFFYSKSHFNEKKSEN
jgi:hypothetical protein